MPGWRADPSKPRRRMSGAEFREAGLLQEVNRQLLHPLGLALEMTRATNGDEVIHVAPGGTQKLLDIIDKAIAAGVVDRDDVESLRDDVVWHSESLEPGTTWISGVWDERDDPEGIIFTGGDEQARIERKENVATLLAARSPARLKALGYIIQPIGGQP